MNNPYLDRAKKYLSRDYDFNLFYDAFVARRKLVREYSYAIPNDAAIEELANHAPIIEFGAGTGYWASLLNSIGVKVVAFDRSPGPMKNSYQFTKQHFNVKKGYPIILKKYPKHTLFLCWPCYATDFAFEALNRYTGNVFIYVGELRDGCTGNDNFFDLLDKKWNLNKTINIPIWPGMRDGMFVYVKKTFDKAAK